MINKLFIPIISFFAVMSIFTIGVVANETASLLEGQTTIAHVENFNQTVNITTAQVSDIISDVSLGGTGGFAEDGDTTATSTTLVNHTYGNSVFDTRRWGDDPAINARSETTHYVQTDFITNSSTFFSIQLLESSAPEENARVYIEEIAIKTTGSATFTIALFIGTSSDGFFNISDINTIKNISASSACSLGDDIVLTDGGTLDATNTVLYLPANGYEPCDVGYGTDIRNVAIKPGDHIIGVATGTDKESTELENGIDGARLDGRVYIKYRVIK